MTITVKNVKYMASMSEETLCFTATVYFNGKKFGYAKNRGHGGETFVDYDRKDMDIYDAARDYAAEQPAIVTDMKDPHDSSKMFTYEQSLESMVDDAVQRFLAERDLKRELNKEIIFTCDELDGLRALKKAKFKGRDLPALLKNKYTNVTIINELSLDQAMEIFNAG